MFLDSKVRDNIFELMDGLWLYQIEKTINHIESEQNRRSMFVESPQDAGDYGIFPIKMPINSESTSFSTEMLKRKRSKQLQGVFKIHFGEELAARESPLSPFFHQKFLNCKKTIQYFSSRETWISRDTFTLQSTFFASILRRE